MRYVPVLTLALALVLAGCGGSYEPSDPADVARSYRDEFGSRPPENVRHIHSKVFMQGDAAVAWLRFEATPEIVDALVGRFEPSRRESFAENTGGANIPAWWTPEQHHLTTFYEVAGWRRDFSHSVAYLAHDADKRMVYFCHEAFD